MFIGGKKIGDMGSSLSEDVDENDTPPIISVHESIISTLRTNDVNKDEASTHEFRIDKSCDIGNRTILKRRSR